MVPILPLVGLFLLGACAQARPQLRFRTDGTFDIVQLTDLHYGSWPSYKDRQTSKVQRVVLAAEAGAGLVVYSGDLVTGFMQPLRSRLSNDAWLERRWAAAVAPAIAAGLPYAVTLGNHDTGSSRSPREVVTQDMQNELSLTQQGPEGITGASNYWVDILEPSGAAVAARVWFLDSGNRGCADSARSWGCVGADTLAWVEQQAALLPSVPSLAFIHIPLQQFVEAWNSGPTSGEKGEDSGCPSLDNGAFQALRRAGVQAIYSGHDHRNSFAGELDGVRLAYGLKTGYGNYPFPSMLNAYVHGARIIRLRQGESAARSETWLRLEDGSRLDQAPTPEASKRQPQQASCPTPWWP